MLGRLVAGRGGAPAIMAARGRRTETISFEGLEAAGRRVEEILRAKGLQPGDTVLVFYPMSIELYVALLAIFRMELIAMFLDPSAGRDHIERCCSIHPPQALIASPRAHLLRLVSPALRQVPLHFVFGRSLLALFTPTIRLPRMGSAECGMRTVRYRYSDDAKPQADKQVCSKPGTPNPGSQAQSQNTSQVQALITFTSGSTGQPKATVRSHEFLLAQYQALQSVLELEPGKLEPGEIDLATLPIFMLANLASGVTSLIPDVDLRRPGNLRPARLAARIHQYHPTRMTASPAFLERLAVYAVREGIQFPSLKRIFTGGGPVFPDLLARLLRMAPASEIVAVYGSTEAEPIASIAYRQISPADLTAMMGGGGLLAGLPVPSIRLQILRQRWGLPIGPYTSQGFEADCVPAGEPGEIVVSGEHVLTGYLHSEGEKETKFWVKETRWHRTGDAGYLDERGRLWLLGRCDARMEDQYGVLYPFSVECAAHQVPGISRAALVSRQGRRVLLVELQHSSANLATLADLRTLKDTLAWAHLESIQVCRRIPMDKRHNSKVDYAALKRMV